MKLYMSNAPKKDTQKQDIRDKDQDHARTVLQTEIEGLQALQDALDENFDAAVTRVHEMKNNASHGRFIIAGIGKSGHVGRKIAATLASTGTPSYFVHPGEASHGDMGMITEHDIVLMLSNSGENSELTDLPPLRHYPDRDDQQRGQHTRPACRYHIAVAQSTRSVPQRSRPDNIDNDDDCIRRCFGGCPASPYGSDTRTIQSLPSGR